MKKVVDFEQAKRLIDCDICIPSDFEVNSFNAYIWNDNEPSINFYYAPNIGELIEWISNQQIKSDCYSSYMMCVAHEILEVGICQTELIDRLVELVIKIKIKEEL